MSRGFLMNPVLDNLSKIDIQFVKWPFALNIENVMQRPVSWTILHFFPADLQIRGAASVCCGDFAHLSARFGRGNLMRTKAVGLP
jgi:hypothetical protein